MKKILAILTILVCAHSVSAFDFDGIDLNQTFYKVSQEISKRGYYFDSDKNCLRGVCQGTEIYLRINYTDVSKRGMVGQLIVEIPVLPEGRTLEDVTTLLNVIYHQVGRTSESITYEVDKDGTQLEISQRGNSYFLTYNTPFYRVRK